MTTDGTRKPSGMPVMEARITTKRASRYLTQFCKHATAMGSAGHTSRLHLHGAASHRDVTVTAEWSDTQATVTFTPWGRCTLLADDDTLVLRIDAADDEGQRQIRDVMTRDLERFSRRDPLTVAWHQCASPGAAASRAATGVIGDPHHRPVWARRRTVLIAVAVTVLLGLHLGLAGTVVADSSWTGMATDVAVALVALKVALFALARGLRRRRATGPHRP
nr:DUF2218 domain-containing protein [Streptomyces sp. NBC_00899]